MAISNSYVSLPEGRFPAKKEKKRRASSPAPVVAPGRFGAWL